MKQYHIYGIGAGLVDTEIQVDDAFLAQMGVEKGLMTLVDEARQHALMDHLKDHLVHSKRASGGSAANSVIAASYFGAKAFYTCRVANDDNGEFYLDDMLKAGVKCASQGLRPSGITGKCLVLITPDAERTMNTFLGVSETLSVSDLDHEALAASEYLYMEGYVVTSPTGRAAAIEARKIAESKGVKTAISLSDPGIVAYFKDGLREMIGQKVDLLFCNKAEAMEWTGAETLPQAIDELKKVARSFAITLGAEGSLVFDGASLFDVPGHAVKAVDTNGAGDMFAGAFLYAITHGKNFEQAALLANAAAAEVVSRFGPRLPAKRHAEILSAVYS